MAFYVAIFMWCGELKREHNRRLEGLESRKREQEHKQNFQEEIKRYHTHIKLEAKRDITSDGNVI